MIIVIVIIVIIVTHAHQIEPFQCTTSLRAVGHVPSERLRVGPRDPLLVIQWWCHGPNPWLDGMSYGMMTCKNPRNIASSNLLGGCWFGIVQDTIGYHGNPEPEERVSVGILFWSCWVCGFFDLPASFDGQYGSLHQIRWLRPSNTIKYHCFRVWFTGDLWIQPFVLLGWLLDGLDLGIYNMIWSEIIQWSRGAVQPNALVVVDDVANFTGDWSGSVAIDSVVSADY